MYVVTTANHPYTTDGRNVKGTRKRRITYTIPEMRRRIDELQNCVGDDHIAHCTNRAPDKNRKIT